MASFISDAERARLSRFPADVPHQDLVAYFTLSAADRRQIPTTTAPHNRLGFALQLGALRYLGFCPKDIHATPRPVVVYVAEQVGVAPNRLRDYGNRSHTRTDHILLAQSYLGFRKAPAAELRNLRAWLVERALEHDRPSLLLALLCERLRKERFIRPNLFALGQMVTNARKEAQRETYRLVSPLLTDERKTTLDSLLITDEETGRTPLVWLRQEANSSKPRSILETVEKLRHLRTLRVADIDLEMLNPNRRKSLARIGRSSTAQALSRMMPDRRYPILLAFLEHVRQEIVDELVEQFDRSMGDTNARARRALDEQKIANARHTSPMMRLLRDLCHFATNPEIADAALRQAIYEQLASPEELKATAERCEQFIRPDDDGQFELLADHYGYLRQFTPAVLEALDLHSNRDDDPLLAAVEVLRWMNRERVRKVPADAPTNFIPDKWRGYVTGDEGEISRRYYELCVLWQLRDAMRSGDVWIKQSRRYGQASMARPCNWQDRCAVAA